jgi:hypothetical protein
VQQLDVFLQLLLEGLDLNCLHLLELQFVLVFYQVQELVDDLAERVVFRRKLSTQSRILSHQFQGLLQKTAAVSIPAARQ